MEKPTLRTRRYGKTWYFNIDFGWLHEGTKRKRIGILKSVGDSELDAHKVGKAIMQRFFSSGNNSVETVKNMQKKLSKDYIQQIRKELAADAKEEPKQEAIEPPQRLNVVGDAKQRQNVVKPTEKEPPAPVAVASSSSSEPSPRKRKTRKSKLSEWQSYPAFGIRPNPADFDCLIPLKPFDVDLLALIFYCERAMPDSACSFSIDTIAQKNNISKDMVRDSIKRLYKDGLISQTKRVKKSTLLTLSEKTRLQMVQLSSRNFRHDNNLSSGKNLQDNSLSNRKFPQDNDLSSRKFLQDKNLSSGKNLQDKNYLVGNSNKIGAYLVGNSDPIKNIYNKQQQHKGDVDKVVVDVEPLQEENDGLMDFMQSDDFLKCLDVWQKGTGRDDINKIQIDTLQEFIKLYSCEWVLHALRETFIKGVSGNIFGYARTILESWQKSGRVRPWEHDSRPTDSHSAGQAMTQEELGAARAAQEAESARIHKQFLESEDW